MPKVAIDHITYSVGKRSILKDISMEINKGEVFALLGDNGSGKTTMIEVLVGFINADSGEISFENGNSFGDIKEHTGVLWDDLSIFPLLKVKEVIHYISNIFGLKETNYRQLYDRLELDKIQNQLMKKLSRGERKRVEILLATMHKPDLLILDEPTSELDPLVREKVWHNIFLQDRTILFTTHQWEEARKYANSIAFIYNGKLLNKPSSYDNLARSFAFSNKIITSKEVQIDVPDEVFMYENENKKIALVPDEKHPIIDQIRKSTVNYSILPIELEDMYRYLIEEKT